MKRVEQVQRVKDRIENRSLEYHRRVVAGYAKYIHLAHERIERVDALKGEDAVAAEVMRVCEAAMSGARA